jgi:nucleotide-binding universal stress UspA family protein
MPDDPGRPDRIVVGVDGSDASLAALAWALREAEHMGAELDVVTAWPDPDAAFVHEVPGHHCLPRENAVAAQETALLVARADPARFAGLVSVIENAPATDALVDCAGGAVMLVVGASKEPVSGRHRHAPIDEACLRRASCPVVVVARAEDEGALP